MKGAWWIGKDDLDAQQQAVITLPPEKSVLVTGPPGSGKTNLLLLRANYLYLAGIKNILILVFTRTLREFLAVGGEGYDFPTEKILTSRRWAQDFLYEQGIKTDATGASFQEQRGQLLAQIRILLEDQHIENIYDAILLDEAQDYSPQEVELFRRLAPRLFIAADKKQKIYAGDDCLDVLPNLVDETHNLELHYRNGEKICRVADGLGKKWHDYMPMLEGCNYDEASMPSSVECELCDSIDAEADQMFSRIKLQLKAYPDELIGVITPRTNEIEALWHRIEASDLLHQSVLHGANEHHDFDENTRICVTTMHGAKGLEFRALHFAGAEYLKRFPNQRQLAFTTVTRCKTSLTVYHSGELPGYLQSALADVLPIADLPNLNDLFGKKS